MHDFDVGDLIEVLEDHRVPSEESSTYTRIYAKNKWPYNTSEDTLIPKGQHCLVLEKSACWEQMNLWFVHVLIVNSALGYSHLQVSIDASRAKLVKKGSGSSFKAVKQQR